MSGRDLMEWLAGQPKDVLDRPVVAQCQPNLPNEWWCERYQISVADAPAAEAGGNAYIYLYEDGQEA